MHISLRCGQPVHHPLLKQSVVHEPMTPLESSRLTNVALCAGSRFSFSKTNHPNDIINSLVPGILIDTATDALIHTVVLGTVGGALLGSALVA